MKALTSASLRHGQRELWLRRAHSRRSDVAVLNSVRDEARELPEGMDQGRSGFVTLDEMWHFLEKTEKTVALAGL